MFSRILVAASLTLLSLPAYCQTPPAIHPTTVPDYILYDHFLHRVMWFETQANNLKAMGKNDAFMRSWMRVHAGLTGQEEANLKAIASDSVAKTTAIIGAGSALAASSGVTPATVQQFQSLASQRQQTVQDHMGQLQAAFGTARFAVLDAFARQIVKFGGQASIPAGFVPKAPGK